MALWSNASVLDRKIEGLNLAANSYFSNERPRSARKKETNWKLATLLEGAGYFFTIFDWELNLFIVLWCKKAVKLSNQ